VDLLPTEDLPSRLEEEEIPSGTQPDLLISRSDVSVATLSFEDPSVCLFSNPPDSGADPYDGCTDGDLIVSLRWDSYGSRTKTILSDGTIVYSRAATVSGSVTFNGSPLFDPAILTTAAISRYVYA
jgi:hypothetical protein